MRSSVTSAPRFRAPPSLAMACSPAILLMLTSRLGAVISSFISESKSLPPARISTSPQFCPRRVGTCSGVVGLMYSNGRIATSFGVERRQDAIWSKWQEGHAHPDSIGDGIRDRRHRADGGGLAQTDGAAFVIALAGHHVHHK